MILELRKLSLIAEGLLNEMIPFSSNKLLPRGSDAIKIDLFIGNEFIKIRKAKILNDFEHVVTEWLCLFCQLCSIKTKISTFKDAALYNVRIKGTMRVATG